MYDPSTRPQTVLLWDYLKELGELWGARGAPGGPGRSSRKKLNTSPLKCESSINICNFTEGF